MKIYFVRHGETNENVAGRLSGHSEASLTEKGTEQAEAAVALIPTDVTAIYSSDLIRCKQTAEILNKNLQLHVTYDARLRERDFGSLSGMSWAEVDPEGLRKGRDLRLDYDYSPEGGESIDDVRARVLASLEDMRKNESGAVLAVTSAGVIRLLHHMLNNELKEIIHNSSFHEFELEDK